VDLYFIPGVLGGGGGGGIFIYIYIYIYKIQISIFFNNTKNNIPPPLIPHTPV
jgi:hypothetical protein